MDIAILGCGPAGLLAAHAGRLLGHEVMIFSKKQRSQMRGAQYMHHHIPGLPTEASVKLAYVLHGEIDSYRTKVYGDNTYDDIAVSPQLFVGFHEAWNIRQAYNTLWKKYNGLIVNTSITQDILHRIVGGFDVCLSTIPAPLLCYQNHQFHDVKVWIDNTWHGPDPVMNHEYYGTPHVVLCNGLPYDKHHVRQTGWYRTSLIYSHANTEWISKSDAIPTTAKQITKPLTTDCDCWPTIIRAGRYGEWRKGVLTHNAFETALEAFN
jgi:hypothetical protein